MSHATISQATLSVPDITCGHCERVITKALSPIAGVERVDVDIPRKQVRVEFDPATVSLEQMAAVLAEEEYPVAGIGTANGQRQETRTMTMAKDPVCGMDVDPATATHTSDYQGQTYSFCSAGCKRAFEVNPLRYLSATQSSEAGGCSCCSSGG